MDLSPGRPSGPPGPPLLMRGGCRPLALPALEVPSVSAVDRTHQDPGVPHMRKTNMLVFLI